MNTLLTRTLVLTCIVVVAGACEIDRSSVGPPGPPGPPGRDGNANVFSLPFDFSLEDAAFTPYVASLSYDVPDLTPSVVDEGAVLVYFRDAEGTWSALPFTFGFEAPDEPVVDYTVTFGYAYEVDRLDVFLEASTSDDVVWGYIFEDFGGVFEMKAVVIDGFPAAKADVDLRDYEAVKAYFGLDE